MKTAHRLPGTAIAALLLLAALLVSHLGPFQPIARAATPVFRVFATYERGHGEQQLTFLKGDATDPLGHTTPQPCGSGKVIFEMGAHAQILDIATGGITELAPGGYFPRCNPQGTKIAYTGGSFKTLHVMNVNGSNPVQLSTTPDAYHPVWDTSGTRLAFDTFSNGIRVIGADASGEAQVTPTGANPTFAPNGDISFEDTDFGISTYHFATATVSKLMGGFADMPAREPTWSITGKLAYSVTYPGTIPPNSTRNEIWVYDQVKNTNTRWTSGLKAAWSADGAFFTFNRESNQTSAGPGVGISIGGSAVEGGNIPIILRRFGDLSTEIKFTIRFESGTATGSTTPGSQDFNSSAIQFTLPAGLQQLVLMHPTNDDNEYEPGANETFVAYIGELQGGHIEGTGEAEAQIVDNELPPSTIVSPPVSSNPPVYAAQDQTAFELSVPRDDNATVFISVSQNGQEVFSREQTATPIIIGSAPTEAELAAAGEVKICVWGTLTTKGCPVMPDNLRQFDKTVNFTLTVTYLDRTATRPFVTSFEYYRLQLPVIVT
jgi:hypothetical protein